MNEELIRRHNERVMPDDTCYILGDFAMGKRELIPSILQRMVGRIIIILGNHDPSAKKMREYGFAEVHNELKIEIDGIKLFLKHHPTPKFQHWDECKYHLHGHVHCEYARKNNLINVGVDVSNFYPLTFDELLKRDQ